MARVNVSLPDELAAAARDAGLNVSAVTQAAIRSSLAAGSTDVWLATLRPLPHRASHADVLGALDAAREGPATRHG